MSISLKLSGTATVIKAPTSRPTRSGDAISFKSVPKAYENAFFTIQLFLSSQLSALLHWLRPLRFPQP